jgi:hypothetical protein
MSENSHTPKYSLRKGAGFWELTFNGRRAAFKHDQGAAYVAYLLLNPPPEPIHALDLATRIAVLQGKQPVSAEVADPATGQTVLLSADARIQERSPELDNAIATRAVLRKQEELEELLQDEDQIEPIRLEAQRDLIALYDYEKSTGPKVRDSAQKAVRAVRMAINRFYARLLNSRDATGNPHPVLREFAAHLEKHLLLPSARHTLARGRLTRSELAGRFTYEPPPGVTWSP